MNDQNVPISLSHVISSEQRDELQNIFEHESHAFHTNANGDPLIPGGTYDVSYVSHEAKPVKLWGRYRIAVTVSIDDGAYHGVELKIYYAVCMVDNTFQPYKASSSHLRRDTVAILGEATIELDRLADIPLTAKVTTVSRDSDGDALPKNQQYSKAGKLRPRCTREPVDHSRMASPVPAPEPFPMAVPFPSPIPSSKEAG